MKFYINTFGNIKLDFSNLDDTEKKCLMKKLKISTEPDTFYVNDFNNYITLEYQCKKVSTYLKIKYI